MTNDSKTARQTKNDTQYRNTYIQNEITRSRQNTITTMNNTDIPNNDRETDTTTERNTDIRT